MTPVERNQYGFKWGSLTVERACSDEKEGWVLLLLKTKKYPDGIQVVATKSGIVKFDGKRYDK